MLNIFKTTETGLSQLDDFEEGSWVDLVAPSEEELDLTSTALSIPMDLLRSALDPEEKSRVEVDDEVTLILVDIPVVKRMGEDQGYDTIPLGMLVLPEHVVTVCLQTNPILGEFERSTIRTFATFKKTRFILQILQEISSFYLRYLVRINRETDKLERELRASMKNAELFDLLTLEKALVYFTTSLRSNDAVLTRLTRSGTIKMYEEDEDLLEDVIIDNRQALEMSQVYSNILAGMMDAFASVISNNLNMVMKFLTSVTIILGLPTMVASFYGMNVILPFGHGESSWGFVYALVISAVIASLAALIFWRRNYL